MRKHFLWVLGLALAIGVTAIAGAANTQKFSAKVTTTKLPKDKFAGTKLHTITEAGSTESGVPLAVKPATKVQVYYDNDIKFNPAGIPACPATKVQNLDTAGAKAACPKSIVGTGKGTAFIAGNTLASIPTVITAFNGPKQGGKSTIVLHTRADAAGNTTALTGVLNKTGGDLGNRLDVTVPPLPGSTALGLFDVTVGKKTGKNQYISAKCGDKDKKLNYKASFKYSGGEPGKTLTYKQSCKVK